MPPIRFRIRTIMIIIAVWAVMMGLYRLSPPAFYGLLGFAALFPLLLVSPVVLIPFIAVYDWFVRATPAVHERPITHPGDQNRLRAGRPREGRLRMEWKTINGRRYYYKSERKGGRVKSTTAVLRQWGSILVAPKPNRQDAGNKTPRVGCIPSEPRRSRIPRIGLNHKRTIAMFDSDSPAAGSVAGWERIVAYLVTILAVRAELRQQDDAPHAERGVVVPAGAGKWTS